MTGWIKLHRSLMHNEVWEDRPFCSGAAWVDLLMMAGHQDRSLWIDGVQVELKRGEIMTSMSKLGLRWGWDRRKVSRFLRWLQTRSMIGLKVSRKMTNITLSNYETYNGSLPTDVQQDVQQDANRTAQSRMSKNVREEREALNASLGIGEKDQVAGLAAWGAWVRDDCRPEWQAIIDQHGFEASRDAVKRIRAECGSDKIFPSQAVDALLGSAPDDTPEW